MYLTQKDREVRFHAAQSILTFGGLAILTVSVNIVNTIAGSVLLTLLSLLISLVSFGLWIFLSIHGYQLKHTKLPVVGDLAEQWVLKIIPSTPRNGLIVRHGLGAPSWHRFLAVCNRARAEWMAVSLLSLKYRSALTEVQIEVAIRAGRLHSMWLSGVDVGPSARALGLAKTHGCRITPGHDQEHVRILKVLNHILTHVTGVLAGPGQQVLQAARTRVTGVFGDSPAVLAEQIRQQHTH